MSNGSESAEVRRVPEFTRPQLLSLLGFEEGDLFTYDQYAEQLSATTALDALEELLDHHECDTWLKGAGDIRAYLTTNEGWEQIDAYRRDEISDNQKDDWADYIVEHLREMFGEEYGNHDDGDDGLDDVAAAEFKARAAALVEFYVSKAQVFNCTKVRSWKLDSLDLLEVVEQLRPEWLGVNWAVEMKREGP